MRPQLCNALGTRTLHENVARELHLVFCEQRLHPGDEYKALNHCRGECGDDEARSMCAVAQVRVADLMEQPADREDDRADKGGNRKCEPGERDT